MIYWDVRSAGEHPALRDGAPPDGLLSAPERVFLDRLRTPKRRAEWILGRYAAKALCRAWLARQGSPAAATALTVAAAPDGAPFVILAGGGALPLTISISHSAGLAAAALVEGARQPLGIDIELSEPRSDGFIEDFFAPAEQSCLQSLPPADRQRGANEMWSLKEAALKAVRMGLRADTRDVVTQCRPRSSSGWTEVPVKLQIPDAPGQGRAFVRDEGTHVLSIAWLGAGDAAIGPADALRGGAAFESSTASPEPVY